MGQLKGVDRVSRFLLSLGHHQHVVAYSYTVYGHMRTVVCPPDDATTAEAYAYADDVIIINSTRNE